MVCRGVASLQVLLCYDLQTFTVSEPVWLKYLQFHFTSHHGSEPICALNDILVFGKSAAEDLEDQLSDEALLTADEQSQHKAAEPEAPSDRQGVHVDTMSKSTAARPGPQAASQAAVGEKNTTREPVGGPEGNSSNVSDTLPSGSVSPQSNLQQTATEPILGGQHQGQQLRHLYSTYIYLVLHEGSALPQNLLTLTTVDSHQQSRLLHP